jgi:hypothetical protein
MKRTLFFICTVLAAAACQRSDDRDSRASTRDTTSSPTTTNPNPATTTLSNRPADDSARPNVPAAARGEPAGNSATGSISEKSADNTGKNERDRSASAQTSGDQGGSEADRHVTQQIRKTVVDDPKLSTSAKNVKIITENGVVTLRGPVKSTQEKTEIAAIAQKVDGVKRIDNKLEIAK